MHYLNIYSYWCYGISKENRVSISSEILLAIYGANDNGSGVNFWPTKSIKPEFDRWVPLHFSLQISKPYLLNASVAKFRAI